jgi:xanthine dehydrogenase accessory factor
MAKVWHHIRQAIERQGSAALVSVVGVVGSAPREAGARMVVQPDAGIFGTIGGGRLEYEALAAVRAAMPAGRGQAQFRDWPLGPDLGQCCGGLVTTLIETFDANDLDMVRRFEEMERSGSFVTVSRIDETGRIARMPAQIAEANDKVPRAKILSGTPFSEAFGEATTPVLLFGAGHVGRALILALAPLPFTVRWVDDRADQFPQHVPGNVVTVYTPIPASEIAEAPADALVIVMTHSHPLDYDITCAALKRGTFRFVGLIGSHSKRARFISWAKKMNVAQSELDRLVCPIGIPQIKGRQPAVIAASIAAQILAEREPRDDNA